MRIQSKKLTALFHIKSRFYGFEQVFLKSLRKISILKLVKMIICYHNIPKIFIFICIFFPSIKEWEKITHYWIL